MEPDLLNQMKTFDFRNAFDVVCMFEDNENKIIEIIDDVEQKDPKKKKTYSENCLSIKAALSNQLKTQEDKIMVSECNNNSVNDRNNEISLLPGTNIANNNYDCNKVHGNADGTSKILRNSMLRMVIDQLLFIVQTHNVHISKINKAENDECAILKSWKQYLDIKHHVYALLYSSVVTMFLPLENNEYFVKNFINKTLQFANNKKISCTYGLIELLFKDMLQWSKDKQNYLNTMKSACDTALAEENEQQDRYQGVNNTTEVENKMAPAKTSKICIFSSGTSENKISIDVDTNLLAKHSNLKQSRKYESNDFTIGTHKTTENVVRDVQTFNSRIRPTIDQSQYSSENLQAVHMDSRPRRGPQMMNTHHINNINPYACNMYLNKQPNQNNTSQGTIFLHKSLTGANNINRNLSRLPPPYISKSNHTMQSQNFQPIPNTQPIVIQNNITNFEYQYQTVRCKSTDSGFMSPHHEFTMNDVSNELDANPQISNNTSLSYNAMHISKVCCVCKKATDQKCLGCYKYYYCSNHCQQQDWNIHRKYCFRR